MAEIRLARTSCEAPPREREDRRALVEEGQRLLAFRAGRDAGVGAQVRVAVITLPD
jgi:hypothetical protein